MGTEALEAIVDAAAAERIPEATLRDRCRGVLLGLAAGNALGLAVEGESQASIRRHYPQGVRDVDPGERTRPWDDDLAQAALLAEVLCESEELDPEVLAARLVDWARNNGRGMGGLTRRVISYLERGADAHQAARAAWEESGWSTAGNAAVMRSPPVGVRWRRSGVDLVRAGRTSALVTHYDARCEWSAVVTAATVAGTLAGAVPSLEELADAVAAVGGDGWTADAVAEVSETVRRIPSRLRDLQLDDPMDMGYTLKAMAVGLWCLEQDGDFEAVLVEVVAAGGDTDTNGAVAGAVMGARRGEADIPGRWLDNIAGVDRLRELADCLYDVS